MRKGVSELISYTMFLVVVIAALAIILNADIPMMDKISDTQAIGNAKDFLSNLDAKIRDIAGEGKNSAGRISLGFNRGNYYCNSSKNSIYYEIETESKAVSINASKKLGNLIINASPNDDRIITVTLSYQNINLTQCDHIAPGLHNLMIRNKGVENGKRIIGIEEE